MIGLARIGGKGTREQPFQPVGTEEMLEWSMIDLRPGGVGNTGWCLVGAPELPKGATVLGDDPKGKAKATTNILRNRLGVNLDDQSLGREVLALLLEHARTDGNGWRPLQPNKRKKRYEVWLGGELIEAMPLSRGGQVVTDDFNRADGPIGAAWPVTSGTHAIVSNQLHSSAIGVVIHGTPLDSSDMRVTVIGGGVVSDPVAFGPIARINLATSSDGYWAYWRLDAAPGIGTVRLSGNLTAGPTQTLLAGPGTTGGGSEVAIQAIGSTIEVLINEVQYTTVTDTVIPGNFGHGIYAFQLGVSRIDAYRAETFAGVPWTVGRVAWGDTEGWH